MHARRTGVPAAFSLVELLVVIAIISTLIGLLLPALQSAREGSRRTTCSNNLKQVGLAAQCYDGAKKTLPPAVLYDATVSGPDGKYDQNMGPNWAVLLLPFLEENGTYAPIADAVSDYLAKVVLKSGTGSNAWAQVRGVSIAAFRCPTDVVGVPWSGLTNVLGSGVSAYNDNWARGNYAANSGAGTWTGSLNGCNSLQRVANTWSEYSGNTYGRSSGCGYHDMGNGAKVPGNGPLSVNRSSKSIAKIAGADGTSKTIIFDELRIGGQTDPRGTWALGMPGSSITAANGIDTTAPGPNYSGTGLGDMVHGGVNDVASGMSCRNTGTSQQAGSKSLHPNGVQACFADGSVGFVTNQVAQGTWAQLHFFNDGLATTIPE